MGEDVLHQDGLRLLKDKFRKSVWGGGEGGGGVKGRIFRGKPCSERRYIKLETDWSTVSKLRSTFNVEGKQGLSCLILRQYGKSVTEMIYWSDTTPTRTRCL